MRKFRIVIHLTKRQETWLRLEAARLEVSMSEILRRLLDTKMEQDGIEYPVEFK